MSDYENQTIDLDDGNIEIQLYKSNVYALRRTLLFVAFIDLFFNFINSFADDNYIRYISLGLCVLITLGIFGINRYNKYLTWSYIVYNIIEIIGRISILIFYVNLPVFFVVFSLFILIINVWILDLSCKFNSNLSKLSSDNLNELRNGWVPNIVRIIYY